MRRWFRKSEATPEPQPVSRSSTTFLAAGDELQLRATGTGMVVVRTIGKVGTDFEVVNAVRRLERENERLRQLIDRNEFGWGWV